MVAYTKPQHRKIFFSWKHKATSSKRSSNWMVNELDLMPRH